MMKNNKVIYPMMIELNKDIYGDIYYIALPNKIKEKWIQLQKATSNKPLYNLPTITLKKILCSYLDGIVNMNSISEFSEDDKWLICFKEINIKIVVNCFRIWVDEYYIKGKIAFDKKRKNGSDEKVNRLANELLDLLNVDMFNKVIKERIKLFENGLAVSKEAFNLYPQRIIDSLIGREIIFKGKETKIIYSSQNELVTDTINLQIEKNHYSFVIKLSVQTLPPYNKAYLNVDLSIRRWVSTNKNQEASNYISNNKNCYIRVSDKKMQCIKTQYSKEQKKKVWDDIDLRCFKECQINSNVPEFIEVLKKPSNYNKGEIGDILIPYQEGITGIDTRIKSGVPFEDRNIVFNFIKNYLLEVDGISSNIEANGISKPVQNNTADFNDLEVELNYKSEYFNEQLEKALSGEIANIEVYAKGDIKDEFEKYLRLYLGEESKYKVKSCDYNEDIFDRLGGGESNIASLEERISEIMDTLENVKEPTISFVAIHDAKYYEKLKSKFSLDPKSAIRAGFAETGRLTQFITFEKYEEQKIKVEEAVAKYEEKKINIINNGGTVKSQSKTDKVNKAINGAILDGFRQLGVVFNLENSKKVKDKEIIGIHICNYKDTLYGKIHPFPIIVTYDIESSKVMAYCELIDKVDIPYWKAILGLSKLSVKKDIKEINNSISSTTIYRRLERIIYNNKKDNVIIIDSNGVSRKFIEGISNSSISEVDKNEFNQVKRLLISKDKYIDLEKAEKNIAVIRLRHNNEVPSYLVRKKDENSYLQTSGLFKFNELYYSIDQKTPDENKAYKMAESKAINKSRYSHRNMLEIYPMYVSGNEKNHEANELTAVGSVHLMRELSIQFRSQMTILPLPLHLASKMEEYI